MGHDSVLPGKHWTFDGDVTAVFDDMLRRSIPQYEVMRETVFRLGCRHVEPGTSIVDLGCSRGEALQPFVDKFGAQCRFVGVDVSEPMLAAARERFNGYMSSGIVDIRELDLRETFPPERASVVMGILTLQFVPIEYRQRIVQDAHDCLVPGGAFIVVEKVLGANARLDKAFVAEYLDMKRRQGYTEDQIQRKRLSLEGVLVPVTAAWNEELLRMAGFRTVDCFWRWMNFAGWIAVAE